MTTKGEGRSAAVPTNPSGAKRKRGRGRGRSGSLKEKATLQVRPLRQIPHATEHVSVRRLELHPLEVRTRTAPSLQRTDDRGTTGMLRVYMVRPLSPI
jgi:hypothetical protein